MLHLLDQPLLHKYLQLASHITLKLQLLGNPSCRHTAMNPLYSVDIRRSAIFICTSFNFA